MPSNPAYVDFLVASRLELKQQAAETLASQMWETNLESGEYLFHQGQPNDTFYVVYEGAVDVMASSFEGKELVFTSLLPGEPIGEATILEEMTRSASIRAQKNATLLSIGRRPFIALAETEPGIAIALARLSARTLRRLSTRVEGETFTGLSTRLAEALISIAEPDRGGATKAKITQQALADRLGVSRESVNKHLRNWHESGLIEIKRGSVLIHDEAALQLAL